MEGPGRSSCNQIQPTRTPIRKTRGFLFFKGIMLEKEKLIQSEWYRAHALTPEQRKKLLEEKIARAQQYHKAIKQQEALIGSR